MNDKNNTEKKEKESPSDPPPTLPEPNNEVIRTHEEGKGLIDLSKPDPKSEPKPSEQKDSDD